MDNEQKRNDLRNLPGIDVILENDQIASAIQRFGKRLVLHAVRHVVEDARQTILNGGCSPDSNRIIEETIKASDLIGKPQLKPVMNATGIALHTNLGRSPLGEKVLADVRDVVLGYSNLEFDLATATRGKRDDHLNDLLAFVTGGEDAIVVNNNAAGIVLALNTLAQGREVIVSRGELIEIGGSFRIPEIMTAAGAKMVEVGTTNKTRLSDYERAITEDTAMIFKAHKSNFSMKGFTEEASIEELSALSKKREVPFLYDIGSGLLRKPRNLLLGDEPDVQSAIRQGADIVCFSGDKLLGGPQAGVIVGKKAVIDELKRAPMMRALRVGKLTIAALQSVIRHYFDDKSLTENIPLFAMLETSKATLRERAERLRTRVSDARVDAVVVESAAQCGGGTLPDLMIDSYAVKIRFGAKSQKVRSAFAESAFEKLLQLEAPVLGFLRGGELHFDVLTVPDDQIDELSCRIISVLDGGSQT